MRAENASIRVETLKSGVENLDIQYAFWEIRYAFASRGAENASAVRDAFRGGRALLDRLAPVADLARRQVQLAMAVAAEQEGRLISAATPEARKRVEEFITAYRDRAVALRAQPGGRGGGPRPDPALDGGVRRFHPRAGRGGEGGKLARRRLPDGEGDLVLRDLHRRGHDRGRRAEDHRLRAASPSARVVARGPDPRDRPVARAARWPRCGALRSSRASTSSRALARIARRWVLAVRLHRAGASSRLDVGEASRSPCSPSSAARWRSASASARRTMHQEPRSAD
ncbi:MAG: hypothetical protein MZW92_13445 [Comamonadaceae bacterium]|nr:hypothetical protein [Comamonadaceae bacterium]